MKASPVAPIVASKFALQPGIDDGSPTMRLELLDEAGDVLTVFYMNLQTAEACCITLAMWYNQNSPGQTAPTTTRIQ